MMFSSCDKYQVFKKANYLWAFGEINALELVISIFWLGEGLKTLKLG